MTDPRNLPDPYPRVVATAELVAAVSGGHVSFDATERSRKSGDQHNIDIAAWLPDHTDNDQLFILLCAEPEQPAGTALIDRAAAAAKDLEAVEVTVCSPGGFTRPARKRATERDVELFTPGDADETVWPGWMGGGGLGQEELRWQITGVTLPPNAPVPESVLDKLFQPTDGLFENPTGTQLSAHQLLTRWLKHPTNEQLLAESAGTPEKPAEKDIVMQFDRPMKLLATTVQELPLMGGISFKVKHWIDSRQIPTRLEELVDDDGVVTPTMVTPAFEEDDSYIRMMIRMEPDEETGEMVPAVIVQNAQIPPDAETPDA